MKIKFEDRDEYLRKPIAEKIIKLLSSDVKVSPFIIDGGWGTGKTEFCSKLINLVQEQDSVPFRAIYVDAFKADHADQPLMTLLAAVLSVVPEKEAAPLVKQALPALRFGLKTGGKAAIAWILKQDPVDLGEDLEKAIGQAGDAAVDHAVEKMLQEHQQAEKSIQALKDVLAKVAEDTPIVLFVDELDRCRPDFAVSMLEVIKHVFDVERVKVVLITNTEQLKAVINHSYGGGVDAQRYLDKFVGFSYSLPNYLKRKHQQDVVLVAVRHFATLVGESPMLRDKILNDGYLTGFVGALISARNMSLREVETFVKYLEIYQTLMDGNGFSGRTITGYAMLRVYAVYCYCFYSQLVKQFIGGKYNPSDVMSSIGRDSVFLPDSEYFKPDPLDALAVMLVINAEDVSSLYPKLEGDHGKWWSLTIRKIFDNNMEFIDLNSSSRYVAIVKEVYGILSMASD